MKRRTLLLSGLGTAGALVVGWGFMPARSRLGRPDKLPRSDGLVGLNGWIKIDHNGDVLLTMNRSEMGQGVHTALAMLVAEELDVPLSKVRLRDAGSSKIFGNVAMFVGGLPIHPQDREPGSETDLAKGGRWVVAKLARELGINVTGGSSSVADAWQVLPLAAATARAQLLGAASLRWKLPLNELQVNNGVISHPSGVKAHFGDLARTAAATPAGTVRIKDAKNRTLIGTSAPRIDTLAKTNGSALFGIDIRLPEQVFAVIRHCPMLGGSLGRVDVEPAMRMAGVERVISIGPYAGSTSGLAVVGRTYWHALQGARALEIEWRAPPAGLVNSKRIVQNLEKTAREAAAAGEGFVFHQRGDVKKDMASSKRRVESIYRAPYLAHAALEPINCTVRIKDGKVEVWVPTQAPSLVRSLAARVAGVRPSEVTVHVTYLGGGFGRRLEVDFVGQAVRIALEMGGRPVQLVWPREEDFTHDFYRPAGVAVMQASITSEGQVTGLNITSAGDAVTPRWLERTLPALAGPVDLPDPTASEGLFDLPYMVPHQRIAHVSTLNRVPVGFWRSVGHSHHAFFSEGFIDELALDVRQDPLAFRLLLLEGKPRHGTVLKLAADKAHWGQALPAGHARGIALHESFNSIVAQVVEVSLVEGKPRVHRVVCAADVGTVINPGIVAQQMEGAIIFGLTAALYGRIDIEQGVVQQTNFHNHPMLLLAETPQIEVHLVPSHRPPGGVGEPGTPPVAPALANALFALTGKRLRELPLKL